MSVVSMSILVLNLKRVGCSVLLELHGWVFMCMEVHFDFLNFVWCMRGECVSGLEW